MRRACLLSFLSLGLTAQTTSSVELLTHGPLKHAETMALPATDAERFGLGTAQFVRAFERLGQGLYRHGGRARGIPLLRLPVPENPKPEPIDAEGMRRLLKTFQGDLARAQATLHQVKGSSFTFNLPLGKVKLDLDGDGSATDPLLGLAGRVRGSLPPELQGELLVAFDGADAPWLEGYTHLLMGLADVLLAIDFNPFWNDFGPRLFAGAVRIETPRKDVMETLIWAEPQALGRLRKHLVAMCALSRVTWKRALAETDDDHEWLPSPSQTGVLGVPIRREMIDGWLRMVNELEAILEGRKLLPSWGERKELGFDLKAFLDHPPTRLEPEEMIGDGPGKRYLRKGPKADLKQITGAADVFGGNFMGMAIWFN